MTINCNLGWTVLTLRKTFALIFYCFYTHLYQPRSIKHIYVGLCGEYDPMPSWIVILNIITCHQYFNQKGRMGLAPQLMSLVSRFHSCCQGMTQHSDKGNWSTEQPVLILLFWLNVLWNAEVCADSAASMRLLFNHNKKQGAMTAKYVYICV